MKKRIAATLFAVLMAFGVALAYSQNSQQLLTVAGFNAAIADGTFVTTGNSGCSAATSSIVTQAYFKNCALNKGSACFSGYATTQIPAFAAISACSSAAPAPTPTPTATSGHTTGLTATDGCIGSTSNWPDGGNPIAEAFAANTTAPTGSTCGSGGNHLTAGSAAQKLNAGANVIAGTVVVVGADLYGSTQTLTAGSAGCTQNTATASGTASVELVNSGGTIVASASVSGNAAWSYQTATFTIPSTGVYSIVLLAVTNQSTANGLTTGVRGPCTQLVTVNATGNGYATGATVSSS